MILPQRRVGRNCVIRRAVIDKGCHLPRARSSASTRTRTGAASIVTERGVDAGHPRHARAADPPPPMTANRAAARAALACAHTMTPRRTSTSCWCGTCTSRTTATALSGEFRLPWVYLHAIKDYADMAAHLEAQPGDARGGQLRAGAARPARGLRARSSPRAPARSAAPAPRQARGGAVLAPTERAAAARAVLPRQSRPDDRALPRLPAPARDRARGG